MHGVHRARLTMHLEVLRTNAIEIYYCIAGSYRRIAWTCSWNGDAERNSHGPPGGLTDKLAALTSRRLRARQQIIEIRELFGGGMAAGDGIDIEGDHLRGLKAKIDGL
jgi:hypothetical protein